MITEYLGYLIDEIHSEEDVQYFDIIDQAADLNIAINWLMKGMPRVTDQDVYNSLATVFGDKFEIMSLAEGWRIIQHEDGSTDFIELTMTPSFRKRILEVYQGEKPIRPPYYKRAMEARGMSEEEYMYYFLRHALALYLDVKRNTNNSYVAPVEAVFGDIRSIKMDDVLKQYRQSLTLDTKVRFEIGPGEYIDIDANTSDLLARFTFLNEMFSAERDIITEGQGFIIPQIITESIAARLATIPALMRSPTGDYPTVEAFSELVKDVIVNAKYISDDIEKQLQLSAVDTLLGNMHGGELVNKKWQDNDVFAKEYLSG